jgi:DNA-binding NarL/FixJ family response regulator
VIRVLVVDDHSTVRAAILDLLGSTDGMVAVGEARDGREALELAQLVGPDVVLMDLTMPNMSGIEATRRLASAHPEARVLMFSAA